jgi:hypothetical protein
MRRESLEPGSPSNDLTPPRRLALAALSPVAPCGGAAGSAPRLEFGNAAPRWERILAFRFGFGNETMPQTARPRNPFVALFLISVTPELPLILTSEGSLISPADERNSDGQNRG